jgi:hypothetical protein
VYCANSDLLVLSIHVEKRSPNNSANSTLELLFAKTLRTNRSAIASSLAHHAIKQQKQNHCAFNQPWQRSVWANTKSNQQCRITTWVAFKYSSPTETALANLSISIIALFNKFAQVQEEWGALSSIPKLVRLHGISPAFYAEEKRLASQSLS